MRAVTRALGALWIVLPLAVPAAATTYQMVADPDLADQAPVIVEAVVNTAGSGPAAGAPVTDYQVQVERWLRGKSAADRLTVRVPGGRRPDGVGLKIWGAPALRRGERALLFLVPNADGSFHILHLMLGAFHEEPLGDGRRIAVRDLSEAKAVGGEDGEDRPRDLERFRTWLADRAAGSRRAPDYFVDGDFERPIHAPFNLLDANGVKVRWFEFDEGGSVSWRINSAGQPGLPGGGFAEFQSALAAWNAEPSTPIHYAYAGATDAAGGLDRFDHVNAILFDQPAADPFDCDRGGVLAIGGPWYDSRQKISWGGEEFIPITGADIITNAGIGCWFTRSGNRLKAAEELFGHELGHTLGLDHSCSGSGDCGASAARNDALMRAYVHDDGRGARLAGDDRAALQALYRPGAGQAALAPPAAPGSLTAEQAGLTARLFWQDRSAAEEGFRIYRWAGGGAPGRSARPTRIAELPAGTTVYVDSRLQPGTRYEYQVAAFNAKGESRGPRVVLAVPRAEPLTALALTSKVVPARTGEPVVFSVSFSGPARRARWDFGTGVGFSDSPCAPAAFCATHIFAEPGDHTVKVSLLGDLGQTTQQTLRVHVEGTPVTPVGSQSFLPSVLSAPRGSGPTFRSGLALANDGSSPTLVRVSFQPRGTPAPSPWKDLTLAPGASLLIPDVLRELFGVSGQGSLSLTYLLPAAAGGAGPRVFAFSQTHADAEGGTAGGFGPFVGEEPQAGWSAEEKTAAGLLQGGGIVTTLDVANLDAAGGQVTVDLVDGEGRPVGNPALLSLGPRANRSQRLDRLFPDVERHTGPFSARFRSDGVRFSASATLLGGEIERQVVLPARAAFQSSASGELFIPRVARGAGAFNTFQFSKLVISNPSPQPREIRCELRLRGGEGAAPLFVTLTLPALGSLLFEDVLRDLFGLTEALGSLRISWDDPGEPAPRVLSLAVSSPRGSTGRRFAALVDSRRVEDAAAGHAVSFGAEPSSLVRASYGAVNLGDQPATLRLSLTSPAGAVLRRAEVPLRPKQHFESDLLGIFPGIASGRWTVVAEVSGGGPVLTYVSQIGAEGDLSFVPGSAD